MDLSNGICRKDALNNPAQQMYKMNNCIFVN